METITKKEEAREDVGKKKTEIRNKTAAQQENADSREQRNRREMDQGDKKKLDSVNDPYRKRTRV